jgi:FkbM family methyltransferase
MFNNLQILKEKGYYPNKIFDIGAHHGHWTRNMLNIYPDSKYYLYEAINYKELNDFSLSNIHIFNSILNDKIELVNWYEMRNTGDSMFREKTIHFKNCIISKKLSIDLNTHLLNNNINIEDNDNIFIKIDCQGAEIPILKGASNIITKADFILLEIPLFGQYNENVPSFLEHIHYMNSINFIPYDIVDKHYMNNFNMQIDMLFINKNHKFNQLVNELLIS